MTVGGATGAGAAAKTASAPYTVGETVHHAGFGTGVIVQTMPMAGDTLLVIDFDKAGRKKLMANYARLQRGE